MESNEFKVVIAERDKRKGDMIDTLAPDNYAILTRSEILNPAISFLGNEIEKQMKVISGHLWYVIQSNHGKGH